MRLKRPVSVIYYLLNEKTKVNLLSCYVLEKIHAFGTLSGGYRRVATRLVCRGDSNMCVRVTPPGTKMGYAWLSVYRSSLFFFSPSPSTT